MDIFSGPLPGICNKEISGKLLRTTQLVLLRSTANGQTLLVCREPGTTQTDLIQLLHNVYLSTYTLFQRAQPLQQGLSLAEQGVSGRSEISLRPKACP